MKRKTYRRIIALLITVVLMMAAMPLTVMGAANLPDLNDKTIYYTPDYKGGECIVSSAKCMLRRAAIMRGSSAWDSITNTALRGIATTKGGLFRNSFSYNNDGITYTVANLVIKGSEADKTNLVANMLMTHPEGVIVWGSSASSSGAHGVLVTGCQRGVLYAADSVYNTYGRNVGIREWKSTTMKSISKCTDIWYISSINGRAQTMPAAAATATAAADGTAAGSAAATGAATAASGTAQPAAPTASAAAASTAGYTKPDPLVQITSVRAPQSIRKGRSFSIRGKLYSLRKIKYVRVQILKSSGKSAITVTAKPNKRSYNLLRIDRRVKFRKLKRGTYTYRVKAKTSKGWETLVEQGFTVY